MPDTYDLIVIGGGPGGYVAAIRAAQLGMSVACIDKNPMLGGTCLRVGCIPSKALLESSHLWRQTQHGLAQHGIRIEKASFDLAAMLQRKRQVLETLGKGVAGLLKKHKIARYEGHGRIAGKGKVTIAGGSGKQTQLAAKNIILATGSKPAELKGVKLDGDRVGTSTEALSFEEVPGHLVVIGAGYIGLELGSVWSRLGAKVTVVEYLDRVLPGLDGEIAKKAHDLLKKQGLEFRLGSAVTKAQAQGKRCVVECQGAEPIECDRVLLAVGRVPYTENLGLESAGIKTDKRGFIEVDEHCATAADGIYAIGDCIGGAMLAHKASEEGVAVAERLAGGSGHVNYSVIPAVVFTHPEIAAVGKTEEHLKEEGREYRKGTFPFLANSRARTVAETDGLVKVLADAATDRILGVHIIGHGAGELIAEAAAAMEFAASSEDLAMTCHAHPTLAEAIKEACLAVDKRALHV